MRYESLPANGGPSVVDDAGDLLFRSADPDEVRDWLATRCETVEFDADGNGSIVQIPVEWIGDGELLHLSRRCLDLVS